VAADMFLTYVGIYDSVEDAKADYEAVHDLHVKAGLIDAYDAAVIERKENGKVKIVKKHETPTRVGGVGGGTLGLATGLVIALFPAAAIGGERVGMRLSPHGVNAGMTPYAEIDETYRALVPRLAAAGIQYLHLVDHSAMGAPEVPEALKRELRSAWPRTFVLAGGFDRAGVEAALREGRADLVALGRPFLANPDLVTRLERGMPLNPPDFATFYTPGPAGYTDYPKAA